MRRLLLNILGLYVAPGSFSGKVFPINLGDKSRFKRRQ